VIVDVPAAAARIPIEGFISFPLEIAMEPRSGGEAQSGPPARMIASVAAGGDLH
jgi:hypothetical protein